MEVCSRVVVGSWDRGKIRSLDGLDSFVLVGGRRLGLQGDMALGCDRLVDFGTTGVWKNVGKRNSEEDNTFAERDY